MGCGRKRLRTWRKELAPFAVQPSISGEVNVGKDFYQSLKYISGSNE